jgi:hypothetical protein
MWFVTFVGLPAVNELINRAKWTQAQSIFQALLRALLLPFGKVPVLGDVLRAMATPPPPPLLDPLDLPPPPRAGSEKGFAELHVAIILLLLGAAIFGLVCTVGCGPAGKQYALDYAACMETKGLQVAAGLLNKVDNVLNSGDPQAAAIDSLEQLAGGAGIDATICAVSSWLKSNQAPAGMHAAEKPGVVTAKAWLAKHGVKT